MASTASDLLRLELQAAGDNPAAWGPVANAVFQRLEEAIAGAAEITDTSGTATLTSTDYAADQARMAILRATATLTGNLTIVVPASTKHYIVSNETSGAYTVTVKTSAGTGVDIDQGKAGIVWCDGTDVWFAGAQVDKTGGDRVLTTADEGAGNGLDADTLDGSHASEFAPATSGSAILKGDGAGGTTSAVADTDYQSVPSEGAFANGDKTKLDGIEDDADVTDATNVAAAGALMKTGGTMSGSLNMNANDVVLRDGDTYFSNTVDNLIRYVVTGGITLDIWNTNIESWVPLLSKSYIKTQSTTVGGLTEAGTAGAGARSFVTDATATTFASVVAGGGENAVPVYSDGTNWRIG